MEYKVGQIVISKAGKDKGSPFIILDVSGEYLQLADGAARPLERPKKKKIKHVQPTKTVVLPVKQAIENKEHLKNADFKTALANFKRGQKEDSHG